MKIKVLIDHSREGMEIKKALENWEVENKMENNFLIRWGNWIDEEYHGLLLNSPQSIKNAMDKENVILTLRRSKVRCPRRIKPGKKTDFPIIGRKFEHRGGTDIRIIDSLDEYKRCDQDYFLQYLKIEKEYRVHIMDLEVFFIEEKYNHSSDWYEPIIRSKTFGWELRESSLEDKDKKEIEEMMNLSKGAIYALGLDFGVVNIGKTVEGRYVVLDVDPVCKWMSDECKKAYIREFTKTLSKYDTLMKKNDKITIGADPECLIRDKNTGSILFASDFLKKKGECGLDDRSLESGRKYFPLMEIRPAYSTNPLDVFHSIESIITNMYQYFHYKNVGLYAGSMPVYNYWIGGHIHFGIKPNTKLIKALDNYLALPLMMIEKPYSARQRKKHYGILGNYRLKFHGGFEYCSLSSWLISPEIVAGVLCLGKVIVQEYFNLKDEFLCNYSDIRAFYLVNKLYFKDKIKRIIEHIKNTHSYGIYKDRINPLLEKILSFEEWEEEKDIKEVWGLLSSNETYEMNSKVFIPKKKRKELGIKLGDKIIIVVGKDEYKVEVFPKDDLTSEKEGFINLSEDICRKIGIKERDPVNIWLDYKKNIYKIGPILGIFSYRESHKMGPFGLQTYLFRKMIKFSKNKGMISYVFTIWSADWKNDRIEGYTYDFNQDQWITQYFPIPDVIYDRGDIVNEENYGQYAIEYLRNIRSNNIKFINSIECIEMTNNKWETYRLLNENNMDLYQPDTWEYRKPRCLKNAIERYGHVFLKLKDGSRSKGIFSIEKSDSGKYIIHYKNIYGYNLKMKVEKENLIEALDKKIKEAGCLRNDYIIQEAIELTKYKGKSFEIRVVMQKNSKGIWFRTCMVARVVGTMEKFLDVWNEEDIKASEVLSECFHDRSDEITNHIRKIAKDIVFIIDNMKIKAGEIAIDFAMDEEGNVYVLELNSKPDNLLARIGAYGMRHLAINRILEYARFLVWNQK